LLPAKPLCKAVRALFGSNGKRPGRNELLSRVLSPNSKISIKPRIKWRGVRRVAPNPSCDRHQPACKPGSVGHRPLARTIRDGHSSGATLARSLEQPTRTTSLTSLPRCCRLRERSALPSLFGLAPGVVCHASPVAGAAVRSYRTFSPLLPVPLIPLPVPGGVEGQRFALCGTVPGVAPAGGYPAPHVDGARTFLCRGLSAVAAAAVRPTDLQGMGVGTGRVKPVTPPRRPKINYPEDVVGRLTRSTGCIGDGAVQNGGPRCNIC
jgi:hypothetical protein